MKTVLDIGSAHCGSTLWFQGQTVASPVIKGVHLFLDNIGVLAGTPTEQTGIFKYRSVNALVAIELTDIGCLVLYVAPVCLFLR